MQFPIKILISLTLTTIGFVLGVLIGMTIAGNYFDTFELFGLRGYEAGGPLGGIIVATVFFFLSVYLLKQDPSKKVHT